MSDLSSVIKAYDVRGVYPDTLHEALAESVGRACVEVLGLRTTDGGTGSMIVGRDMRPSGPSLVEAFARGVRATGVRVIDIGLCSTDEMYFASGTLGHAGAMFTASHNPAQYNGIKICRAGAVPVGEDSGLADIRTFVENNHTLPDAPTPGALEDRDVLEDYATYLRSLVGIDDIRPLHIVVDAGNGMAGLTAPAVFSPLPVTVTEMYYELDGNFPNHEANPIDPANLVDLQQRVIAEGADLGLAFDGDADRCFVVDEQGNAVSPSVITALIAERELAKNPGAPIIHNLITSSVVPEIIREKGGQPVRTRVGHSFIKATMAETGAVFGGEHSGHFYFQDFWRADSGMLAALHVIAAVGHRDAVRPASALFSSYERYALSGEINSTVNDIPAALQRIRSAFDRDGNTFDELDGLTVTGDQWWFNVRPSNTEPLLRLNVEHVDEPSMAKLRDEVLALIRQ